MEYTYKTKGVCSQQITVDIENDIIRSVAFVGGCNGNLNGMSALLIGMKVEEAIKRCKGILCGSRTSSCPDQLAIALEEAQKHKETVEIVRKQKINHDN